MLRVSDGDQIHADLSFLAAVNSDSDLAYIIGLCPTTVLSLAS